MRLLVLFLSLAAVLGGIAWTQGNTGSTLIKHADPVGRVKLLTDYEWLSDQAVLLPQLPDNRAAERWQPPALKTKITGLSSRIASHGNDTTGWHLSPDRKLLLWLERSGGDWVVAATPLEESTVSRWPIDPTTLDFTERGGNVAWLPDSRRFFRVSYQKPDLIVRIYDCRKGSAMPEQHRVPFQVPATRKHGARYDSPVAFGTSSTGNLLVNWSPVVTRGTQEPQLTLEIDLSRKPTIIAEHRFRLADGESNGEVTLSPDGKRLALFVDRRLGTRASPTQLELRTCGLDGESMTTLGRVDVSLESHAWRAPNTPQLLRWLPSGRRLSFEYRGRLYTIAAE